MQYTINNSGLSDPHKHGDGWLEFNGAFNTI